MPDPSNGPAAYELHTTVDGVEIRRVEVVGRFADRAEARQWMIDTTDERQARDAGRTPLHELVDLCREQGLALDFAMYGPDDPITGDDTKSTYLGGARITGHKGDPMDVIRAGVRARRDAAEEVHNAG